MVSVEEVIFLVFFLNIDLIFCRRFLKITKEIQMPTMDPTEIMKMSVSELKLN